MNHLVDSFGRVHTDLRVSVTDRCNFRCTYCMPAGVVTFKPREELLSFEEIVGIVSVAASLGVRTVRLTGGEPLVRKEIHRLVGMLVNVEGIDEVTLTTNGLLLEEQASDLFHAGLSRLNVSLDSLDEKTFESLARFNGLQKVLRGIATAQKIGFQTIRINAVSIANLTEREVVPLARFARQQGLTLRFIEFMPLDASEEWTADSVLTGEQVRKILVDSVGPLVQQKQIDPGQPAIDYRWADGIGVVGFVDSVSNPFCDRCDRLRLTADGQLRNCLFSTVEWDARQILRKTFDEREPSDWKTEMALLLHECVTAKARAHGIGTEEFERPERAMYQIGG